MISKEEFEKKALEVLEEQTFINDIKLFESNVLCDFTVSDDFGDLQLDEYINLLYDKLIKG